MIPESKEIKMKQWQSRKTNQPAITAFQLVYFLESSLGLRAA